jgi:biopolymer transport protein ExbB/TolQ
MTDTVETDNIVRKYIAIPRSAVWTFVITMIFMSGVSYRQLVETGEQIAEIKIVARELAERVRYLEREQAATKERHQEVMRAIKRVERNTENQ